MTTVTDRIELVCFDLGRVLIEICRDFHHACHCAGLTAPGCVDDPQVQRTMHKALVAHETGCLDDHGFAQQVAAAVGMSPGDVHRVVTAWIRGPFPGVPELLAELRANEQVQLACLSNTNALHWSIMIEGSGPRALPADCLHYRFASHLVGVMKPNQRIYAHVEQATGIDPGRIIFFDDLAANCQAARQRGWQAHQILPTISPVEQMRSCLNSHGLLGGQ